MVTRDKMWRGDGGYAVATPTRRSRRPPHKERKPIFVAGGGEIYRAAWERLTGLEITEVDAEPVGDVTFPPIDPQVWSEVSREPHQGYVFVSYRRA